MILFVNACAREESRTKRLADCLLSKLTGKTEGLHTSQLTEEAGEAGGPCSPKQTTQVEEVRLSDLSFPVADEAFLAKRDQLIAAGAFEDPMFALARQFAAADQIVIAAPYWDLSFPAALKQYLEQVNVVGITFVYTPEGIPKGLCQAKKIYYIMTAGGTYAPVEFGFGYVTALAQGYYGIEDVELIQAVGLDIVGADVEAILQECDADIKPVYR